MTKKEMKELISNKGLTKELIKGLKKSDLTRLESTLMDAEASNYVDEMLELTVETLASLEDVKRDEDVKKVASNKSKKVEAPKEDKKKKVEAPKNNKKKAEAPKEEKKVEAPKEAPKEEKKKEVAVDFSKYTGYQLERIFKSQYSVLSKEEKRVHTALNKEYEKLKKGMRVNISVKPEFDPNGEYAVAQCMIVYRDAVSAIAVDSNTFSKYEINRIKWALKTDYKNYMAEDGSFQSMELAIEVVE